ncbi:hypothetical protein [Gorillibacterium sp. sgz5001074]|uniref:hypothetical protein n=1 Tax=Gorillibacterium sp. sgz5001074 TaxID=3446695 RepID=UPI003F662B59
MLRSMSLPLQVDMLLRDLQEELCGLTSGTVFVHIMNGWVVNYGVRHRLENRITPNPDGSYPIDCVSIVQVGFFRELASDLIGQKEQWNRGTVSYKFQMKSGCLQVSASYNSLDDECIVE